MLLYSEKNCSIFLDILNFKAYGLLIFFASMKWGVIALIMSTASVECLAVD